MVGFGGTSFVTATGLLIGCVVWKPDLLRSERQEIRNRVMDFIIDSDLGSDTVELTRLVLDEARSKKSAAKLQRPPGANNGKH